jgi:hypothetical protein
MLYLWALEGVLLVIYLLCRKLKKATWIIPIVLIIFSGIDIVPVLLFRFLNTGSFLGWSPTIIMEWWAGWYQYSSNTTQLFWVFNQSIPTWVIMALFIQMEDARYVAGLISLMFAYSPWATIGIVPYALYDSLKGKKALKSALNLFNVMVPCLMLVVFGTFYMASSGSNGNFGLIFMFYDDNLRLLRLYLLFLFVEFGVYYLVMGKAALRYKYFWITLIELIVIPLIVIESLIFGTRASIPALFITMVYVMTYLLEKRQDSGYRIRKKLLVGVLCIGMMTPLVEVNRVVYNTAFSDAPLEREDVRSFGDIQSSEESYILTIKLQFLSYDYEDTIFFRYLAKDVKER